MVSVTHVEVVYDRTVHLTFSDGSERVVDLRPHLRGPMFQRLAEDDEAFGEVHVDPVARTIAWPNGADFAPEMLHGDEPTYSPGT